MRIALINVVALLGLLFPQMLLADGEAAEFTMTPRAQKIFDQAPKTPEELLKVIKEFMEHPDVDGYEFGEKVSGVDRAHWGNSTPIENGYILMYSPFGTHSPYHFRNPKLAQPTSYVSSRIKITKDNLLHAIRIRRFDEGICLSPSLTQKILGAPSRIQVDTPCDPFSGEYRIKYIYENSKYRMRFFFPAQDHSKNVDFDALCGSGFLNSTEERTKMQKTLSCFDNHKSFCVTLIKIHKK